MCGIVGYTGKNSALSPIIDGLSALEYRGYDSAGIFLGSNDTSVLEKEVGQNVDRPRNLAKSVTVE